jgi:hypothetical protein
MGDAQNPAHSPVEVLQPTRGRAPREAAHRAKRGVSGFAVQSAEFRGRRTTRGTQATRKAWCRAQRGQAREAQASQHGHPSAKPPRAARATRNPAERGIPQSRATRAAAQSAQPRGARSTRETRATRARSAQHARSAGKRRAKRGNYARSALSFSAQRGHPRAQHARNAVVAGAGQAGASLPPRRSAPGRRRLTGQGWSEATSAKPTPKAPLRCESPPVQSAATTAMTDSATTEDHRTGKSKRTATKPAAALPTKTYLRF